MFTLDHVVLGVPDLAAACTEFADLTGCEPVFGGPHPGQGTHNALVAFTQGSYLEIIAPDPSQRPLRGTALALAQWTQPQLLHWALRCQGLEQVQQQMRSLGAVPSDVFDTQRQQPSGEQLQWQLMGLLDHEQGGCTPFFIDWCQSIHPSVGAPCVGALHQLEVHLPAPSPLHQFCTQVDQVLVKPGPAAIRLEFESDKGLICYRTTAPMGFAFGPAPRD